VRMTKAGNDNDGNDIYAYKDVDVDDFDMVDVNDVFDVVDIMSSSLSS